MNGSIITEADKISIINKIQKNREEIYTVWNTIKFFNVDELKNNWNDPIGRKFVDLILGCDFYIQQIISNLDTVKKCVSSYDVNTGKSTSIVTQNDFDMSKLDDCDEFGDFADEN